MSITKTVKGQKKWYGGYTQPYAAPMLITITTKKGFECFLFSANKMNYYRKLLLFCILLMYGAQALAQLDSIRYKLETQAAISTEGYLPLWIVSNRFGVLEDGNDALLRAGFEAPYTKGKKFDVSYGLDIIGKKNFSNSRIQQGFLKVKYGIFEVRGGRIEEATGLQYDELSSGSLAQSRNAMPVPKVAITVPEYAPVPFTKGYLEFKGYLGHGWLGNNQYVKNSLLHEKNLYLKVGGILPVNLYGGLVHYAVWGGEHPTRGPLPSGFKDYIQVFQGSEGRGNSPVAGEVGNALGNHLGIYDFGVVTKLNHFKVAVYYQTPWEDLTSLKLFRNKDGLLGINIQPIDKNKIVSAVLYEFLYTKYQSGPGIPDPRPEQDNDNYGHPYGGRDDYYNNYLYCSGWTYQNSIIGTPLFTTKPRAERYFGGFKDYDVYPNSIINNRVVGHHIGITGALNSIISYKAKLTYTRNYGTFAGSNLGRYNWASMDPDVSFDYEFAPPLDQYYFLLEANTILPFHKNITLQTAVGWDLGEMSRNFGVLVGLQWSGITGNIL
jgi:hypothetical protein